MKGGKTHGLRTVTGWRDVLKVMRTMGRKCPMCGSPLRAVSGPTVEHGFTGPEVVDHGPRFACDNPACPHHLWVA
jgi:hypothetical protein